jgi:hypothetical protein
MFVDIVPNRKSRPAILLREAWREGGKIKKRTIANLSDWPMEKVEALREVLRGNHRAAKAKPELVIERSQPHGAAAAVLGTIRKLKLDEMISARRCRQRDLVVGMIAERLMHPGSKLATSRLWSASTLADELGISDADEDDLYAAMDWLLVRQERIERKLGKHFRLVIEDGRLEFSRKEEAIRAEAALDGLYVIRTSEPAEKLPAAEAVRSYKGLSAVERLFRTLKGLDLRVRPIFHRDPNRVRAHIFICLLAYYIEWHMRKALAPLLFDDEFPDQKRDPVAPARISAHAKAKKRRRQTEDGLPLHSFNSLLQDLTTLTRNTCRLDRAPTFTQLSRLTPLQVRAFELLGVRCQ